MTKKYGKIKVFNLTTGDEKKDKDILLRNVRKFNKICEKEGVIRDIRKHESYEKPSVKEKRKNHRRKMTMLRAQMEEQEKITKNIPDFI